MNIVSFVTVILLLVSFLGSFSFICPFPPSSLFGLHLSIEPSSFSSAQTVLTSVAHTCMGQTGSPDSSSLSYSTLGQGRLYSLGIKISHQSLPYFIPSLHWSNALPPPRDFMSPTFTHPASSSICSMCPDPLRHLRCTDFLIQFNPSLFLSSLDDPSFNDTPQNQRIILIISPQSHQPYLL